MSEDELRHALLDALDILIPSNWYESVETLDLLDRIKPLLTDEQCAQLNRDLAGRDG